MVAAGRSAPVTTSTTPGAPRAASRSWPVIRAAACGLRTSRTWQRRGSLRSAVYPVRPSTFRRPSIRGREVPMTLSGIAAAEVRVRGDRGARLQQVGGLDDASAVAALAPARIGARRAEVLVLRRELRV